MIVIDINENQIEKAKTRISIKNGKNTISQDQDDANFIGSLGEIIVIDFFSKIGNKVEDFSCKDYDLIIDSHKIEIKTKKSVGTPKFNWNCYVAEKSMHQNPDFYFWCTIDLQRKKGYILGCLTKEGFLKVAKFNKKGERDGNTNFFFKENSYCCLVSDLKKISQSPFNRNKFEDCLAFWNNFDFDKISGYKYALSRAETITHIQKFVKSHILILESNRKKTLFMPYFLRLKMLTFDYQILFR
jgi:hypothetical protein